MRYIHKIKSKGLNPRKSKTGNWKGKKLFLFGDKRQARKWQKHRPKNTILLQVKAPRKFAKYHGEFLPPHYTTTRKIKPEKY